MTLEPKTCPFCRAEPPAVRLHSRDGFAQVCCDDCGAAGPVFGDEETPLEERKQDAIAAWNRARRLA